MKYNVKDVVIPKEKRTAINQKILHIIDNNIESAITKTDIANGYSGDGGLHELNYNDFRNYHEYSEKKKIIENGQFFTPYSIAKFLVDCVKPNNFDICADLTCGVGRFFNYLPVESNIYGTEIDIKAYKVCKYLYPDANIVAEDIRNYNPEIKFDIIFSNPPFNLKWTVGKEEYLSQLYYCIKAFDLLKPAGILALIVPVSFLADDFSDSGMIRCINSMYNFIYQAELHSNVFKSVGVDSFRTKIMFFQKKSEHITADNPYSTTISPITELTESCSDFIHSTYVKPVIEQKEKVKHKLFFEQLHSNSDNIEFQDKVKKYLFDIKRSKHVKHHYAKCVEYVNRFHTQKQPEGMKYDEWEKVRLTPNKVLSYLKRIIKNQHNVERDEIKLVKNNYGLRLKAYSHKTKLQLSKLTNTKEMSFNDMILNESYPFEDEGYRKLLNKKLNAYNRQSQKLQDMKPDTSITEWLNNYRLFDVLNDRIIQFNDRQREDIGNVLQKRYSLLQWDCGGGKSLAAIAYAQYHIQHKNVHNAFIVAPAIAITGTFEPSLTNFDTPFIKIDSLQSINDIKPNDIVLITFNMLVKYQKHLKKFIKTKNKKVCLILDESDSIATMSSKRTKSTINVFQKVKYKLLTTGTSVRNSIGETFPQLNLMFNSSINFINHCQHIYVEDKKSKELQEKLNEHYMKPYPQYQKGQKLFQESHIPEKITVFGVSRKAQHIYNSDILKSLIDSTIITRTFEEITGRSIANIYQDTCSFNNHEYMLYKKIVNEFYEMARNLHKTGNSRKDKMLEIIQQLNMLIRSCSAAHLFKEYTGTRYSSKFRKVFSMLKKWDNEPVVIGCRFKNTVYSYAKYIRELFPDRRLFVVTGEDMTLKQRRAMIAEMKKEKNPILVCTQQSLSSSISINFVDKIIVTELAWNGASLHQFTARFVRFDSESDNKEIHYVTYENSIESNLLKLILSKEKLTLFLKDEDINDDELYERFGVDFDILNSMLMSKEKDRDGYTRIKWGDQQII